MPTASWLIRSLTAFEQTANALPPSGHPHKTLLPALAVGFEPAKFAFMTAYEVIDQIKALPPGEKTKVEAFVQHAIEERLLSEESPELLGAIDAGVRSLETEGGREYTRAALEQKVRQWARGASR